MYAYILYLCIIVCTFIAIMYKHMNVYIYILYLCAFTAIGLFCESILEYLADTELAAKTGITAEMFEGEVYSAYEHLYNQWLPSKESRVSVVHCTVCTVRVPWVRVYTLMLSALPEMSCCIFYSQEWYI